MLLRKGRNGGIQHEEEKCFVNIHGIVWTRKKTLQILLPRVEQKCHTQSDTASKNASREMMIQLI